MKNIIILFFTMVISQNLFTQLFNRGNYLPSGTYEQYTYLPGNKNKPKKSHAMYYIINEGTHWKYKPVMFEGEGYKYVFKSKGTYTIDGKVFTLIHFPEQKGRLQSKRIFSFSWYYSEKEIREFVCKNCPIKNTIYKFRLLEGEELKTFNSNKDPFKN